MEGIYPAVDSLAFLSHLLDPPVVGKRHYVTYSECSNTAPKGSAANRWDVWKGRSMAILLCTECGAKLTTKNPVAAGNKLRCSKCKKVFAVPAAAEPEKEVTATRDLHEEKKSRVKSPMGTRNADEEGNESGGDADGEGKPSKSAKVARQDNDEYEQNAPAPTSNKGKRDGRKKQRSNARTLIGCVALLLVLGCAGLGAAGFYFNDKINVARILGFDKSVAINAEKDAVKENGKDDKSKGGGDSTKEKPKDKQNDSTPAFKLTAEQFAKEVDQNNTAASKKYNGKVIEFTGRVNHVYLERPKAGSDTKPTVALRIEGGQFGHYYVLVVPIRPEDRNIALRLSKDQTVRIVARQRVGSMYAPYLEFETGALSEIMPSTIREVTSQQLAEEHEAGWMFDSGIPFLLAGEVLDVTQDEKNSKRIVATMKGTETLKVQLALEPAAFFDAEQLAVGKTAVIRVMNFKKDKDVLSVSDFLVTNLEPGKTTNSPEVESKSKSTDIAKSSAAARPREEGLLSEWRKRTFKELPSGAVARFPLEGTLPRAVAFSPTAPELAAVVRKQNKQVLAVWNLSTLQPAREVSLPDTFYLGTSLKYSQHGEFLVFSGQQPNEIRIFKAADMSELKSITLPKNLEPYNIGFTPDSSRLHALLDSGKGEIHFKMWSTGNWQETPITVTTQKARNYLATPDGRHLMESFNTKITYLDVATGMADTRHDRKPEGMSFFRYDGVIAPNGRLVAARGSHSNRVMIRDLDATKTYVATERLSIRWLTFSPDGKYLGYDLDTDNGEFSLIDLATKKKHSVKRDIVSVPMQFSPGGVFVALIMRDTVVLFAVEDIVSKKL